MENKIYINRCGFGVWLYAKFFWNGNNLPKGTTEFVCKNGKAYLPDQVPKG